MHSIIHKLYKQDFFVKNILFYLAILLSFTSCAHQQQNNNTKNALSEHGHKGLDFRIQSGQMFDIASLANLKNCTSRTLYVYIEGDGKTWEKTGRPFADPTPSAPVALELMKSLNQDCSIYLARPCQYLPGSKNCHEKYWTSHRYSYSIVQNYVEILNKLSQKLYIKNITLIGYSGGGAIASLIAIKLENIFSIITVAGNLDTARWTKIHNVTPLFGSLNPSEFASSLRHIPQYHLVGKNDTIVPLDIFESYKSRFKDQKNLYLYLYETDHYKNWAIIFKEFHEQLTSL